jgi:hypothetical protein
MISVDGEQLPHKTLIGILYESSVSCYTIRKSRVGRQYQEIKDEDEQTPKNEQASKDA